MARYSIEPRDRIFLKEYGFRSFAKSMSKNIGKNITVNTARNFLIVLNYLLEIHLKLLQKEKFKNQQKQQLI